jgi:hypothetical protein
VEEGALYCEVELDTLTDGADGVQVRAPAGAPRIAATRSYHIAASRAPSGALSYGPKPTSPDVRQEFTMELETWESGVRPPLVGA